MLCRYTKTEFKGEKIYLAYTVSAMFQFEELLKPEEQALELLDGKGEEGFTRFCQAVSILSRCGAQIRAVEGSPSAPVPEAEELQALMQPKEYLQIKRQAINAILLGYGREVKGQDEEFDEGLAELEKK